MEILDAGFENLVRSKLGVSIYDLPDSDINNIFISELAEAKVKESVPLYASITDPTDLIYLKSATLSYVCYLLSSSMTNRVKIEVQTIDTRWKIERSDWNKLSQIFLDEVQNYLSNISSVEVIDNTIKPAVFDIVAGIGTPIGGD
jgi:hypothetical protein